MGNELSSAQHRHQKLRLASEAFQDGIIAERLPQWLRKVPVAQMPALSHALAKNLEFRLHLAALLARIEGIEDFVTRALEDALAQRYGLSGNVRRVKFLDGHREPVINGQPVGAHLTEVVYTEKPLLDVVLRNFTADEARPGGQPAGNRLLLPRQGSVKPPTAIEFAQLCRTLDLGEGYQRHLDAILLPAHDASRVAALLADGYRYAMLVDAYKASVSNKLDASELAFIRALCVEGQLLPLAGDRVVAKGMTLLGYTIEQVVVFEVIEQGTLFDNTRRLLLYVPGDPVEPWSAFQSLSDLDRALGHRLRIKTYQRFFSRFVLRKDSQAFFSTVVPVFDDLPKWAFYELKPHLKRYPEPLFDSLAQARIRQIKEDAVMVVMPVARLDRDLQRAHDQRLAAEGWTLLNLAGLFVPGIGLALLAVAAWELLDEVYHGIEAWRDGDHQEALDHLTHVATDLAVLAATAAGATVARRFWTRSAVVDDMLPARLEDGSNKLWQQDLALYRSRVPDAAAPPDASGVRRLNEDAWVEMDGHHYAVVEPAGVGQWQLRPRDGHGPALRNNGAGAWRLWSEQPADWDDTQRMFRRLGEPLQGMSDEQIDDVLGFHGLDADHLRALHVYARAPEPGMLDSAERSRLDRRIRQMISRLRSGEPVEDLAALECAQRLPGAVGLSDPALAELAWTQRRVLLGQLYDALQPSDSPGSRMLRRVFPGLHQRAARALLEAASADDRLRLLQHGRVPLSLAEAARHSSMAIRKARVLEAMYLDTPQNADLARVVLGLLKHLPGADQGVRWRLFEGNINGPLLVSLEEGAQVFDLVHRDGSFQVLDAQGAQQGEAGELFEAMAAVYAPDQREAMAVGDPFAHNLRVLLAREARQRRSELDQLLGLRQPGAFRPPQRLPDGRLGYPLGGQNTGGFRRSTQSLPATLRDLYPSFSDGQLAAWTENVVGSGQRVDAVLSALNEQLTALRARLNAWVGEARGELREDRSSVRRTLLDCWQRVTSAGDQLASTEENYRLVIYNTRPQTLPELPAQVSFTHVSDLSFLRMGLSSIPQSFLLAFPRLRVLDLGGNRLTRLPEPLLQMPQLRQLTLTSNEIVLTTSQAATLASAASLEYIDLSHNPLGRTFTLSGLTSLRWLSLRNTGIDNFPHGLNDRLGLLYMDMRENRIHQVPQWFYQAPVGFRRRVRLAGNPLPGDERLRLHASLMRPPEMVHEALMRERLGHVREVWGDAVGPRNRGLLIATWETVDVGESSNRFFRVLRQLLLSADFRINAEALASRVLALLQAMGEEPALREQLLSVANDEWGCQDGATWCLSNLEVNVLVWRARAEGQANSEQALLRLGRRLWRLDEVDRIALRDILDRGGNPDESEVGLAYRLGLRVRLDLPIAVGSMSFRPLAGVNELSLERAEAAVRRAEIQETVARSLVDRSFWQAYLERTHPSRFSQVDGPFQRRLSAVLDDQSLSDQVRSAHSDAILGEQRAARRGLMLDLTLEALETGPADQSIDVR
ncbi:NEL-type E3 ubiquitin ligase domain-containing protein [Pseudomonas sp. NPDC090233]|uniref:NEL-type E3 ubiquitin ligase domain-containing protein n=1 Tax=Pseudomonas sp. NPDC090233 TaxID=3364479 RepID=UPI00383BB579